MDILNKSLFVLTKRQKKFLVLIFFLVLINIILETLSLGLILPIVALLVDYERLVSYNYVSNLIEYFNLDSQNKIIISGMCVLLFVYFCKNIFLAFFSYIQAYFVFSINLSISNQMFSFYLNQPYLFHVDKNSAELIRNVSAESSRLVDTIRSLLILAIEVFILIFILALLIYIQPFVASITFVVIGGTALLFNLLTRKPVLKLGHQRLKYTSEVLKNLLQGLNSIKETLIMWKQKSFMNEFYNSQFMVLNATKNHTFITSLPRLWLEIIALTGLVIMIFLMLMDGQKINNILPTLSLYAVAALRILPGINKVIHSIQVIQYCKPSLDVIYTEFKNYKINKLPDEIDENVNRIINNNKNTFLDFKKIFLSDISFKYPNTDKKILNSINISIDQNSSIGIIGESGSGKSTLVDIFLGLLTPQQGEILVDSKNIKSNLKNWQTNIGYVPQFVFLSDDSIESNIAFGVSKNNINKNKILECLEMAQLSEFVKNLPDGLETLIGEHGARLSGGQRQRIGIARSLYNNPNILVFDEATSSLDNKTEKNFIEVVRQLQKDKTIIIVSHRLTSVKYCDKILKIENGNIYEE